MKKNFLLIILALITCLSSFAQEDSVRFRWDEITWNETMDLFYEPGYLTFAGGIGNMEPLLFEGNIIPYYSIGIDAVKKWAVVLSPQVIVRMYNKYSYPVQTPSYMPRVILVHQSSKHTREYHDWLDRKSTRLNSSHP